MIRHVTGAALRRLMAVGITAGCPQYAREEHGDDYRHYDKRGSDIHVQFLNLRLSELKLPFWVSA